MIRHTVIILVYLLSLVLFPCRGQVIQAYSFLRLPVHARIMGLGGENVSEVNRDRFYAFVNPSLVGDSLRGNLAVNYLHYLADIHQASAFYAHSFQRAGTWTFGFRHVDYGDLEGYDDTGSSLGTFHSADTEWAAATGRQAGFFRMGIAGKVIFSNLAGWRSTALAMDIGGAFLHPNERFSVGMVFRNLGVVIRDFSRNSRNRLPFDLQIGTTYKPEHMPARFSITVNRLNRPGMVFDDPAQAEHLPPWKKAFTHLTMGAEFLVHDNISLLAGFSGLRQYELGRGFSAGISFQVKGINMVLSHMAYAPGAGIWAFAVSVNTHHLWTTKTL